MENKKISDKNQKDKKKVSAGKNENVNINSNNRNGIKIDISADPVYGEPFDSFDMVNKYGTYNIQPTADTHHDYPKIAQGLSKAANEESKRKKFGQK